MKHIISVGHTASGNIGCGAVGLLDESNCTREIGPAVADYIKSAGEESVLLRIDKSNSYNYEDCYVRASQANEIRADTFTEIHINAGGAGASGVEVLLNSMDSRMKPYAEKICENISLALNIPNRGVKVQSLIVLKRTSMPAMLVECCFVDSPDAEKYNPNIIAKAIAGALVNKDLSEDDSVKLGWNKSEDNRWWYCTDIQNKNYYKSEWKLIDGKWYLFDSYGWCITGWVYYKTYKDKKDVWYYLDSINCDMAIGWKNIKGEWYYFNNDGEMQTGWIKDDGKDYLLYSNGTMVHDTILYDYKFDSSGVASKTFLH
ncbi:hypothetical protein HMPREF1084_01916 [Clostridium butyricum 60E.3]|uniref:N-acetylmuramoyl-L-alanine amidase n=1 Tax=Clostridium butyricum TaxID=1492 RepID=UPI0002D1E267|nr:N-acetylmuramoyl-L-alanine amidase [Clostridium butyricum]ALP91160.1 cell wall hydrolase [Clostridium butyricum]ANF14783.1 cell wall hydrolase [Clostridium butyricum]ENZ33447.1 hypothetical protein HMPREF1084_01916 [Clostridium butyricum 60E.3]MCI3009008.1 N-acetylmuramoyl-L-alanine amidase [Clostridium butyricum]MDP0841073.1 N-acetylmuramoyl-L-alanine amidase [Clostridium butyricum]